MTNNEKTSICVFYAISPIHAGTGSSVSAVDLPIQRERHTGWPVIHATGIKGAFRDHFRRKASNIQFINQLFGYDEQDNEKKTGDEDPEPGAFSISDAKLFAFPVRSNVAPFVRVTSPALLKRLNLDLQFIGEPKIEELENLNIKKDDALCFDDSLTGGKEILLEDAITGNIEKANFQLPQFLTDIAGRPLENLLIISNEMFDYCVTSCTEIQTNIKIDSSTGATKSGSLRYQEFLPADTVLYSVVYYQKNLYKGEALSPDKVKDYIENDIKEFIQIGGDNSVGKGLCRIKWFPGGEK